MGATRKPTELASDEMRNESYGAIVVGVGGEVPADLSLDGTTRHDNTVFRLSRFG